MNAIDDLLRSRAAYWRANEAPLPPLEQAVARSVNAPSGQRAWMAIGAAAASVAITSAVVAVAVGAHHSGNGHARTAIGTRQPPLPLSPSAAPPTSIRVESRTVPFAGTVPWAGAVLDRHDSRVFYVEADGDAINARNICGVPTERVFANVTPTSVRVLIAGYASPTPTGCLGVAHAPQRARVVLAEPLGSRTLVDASNDATHTELDPATVPTVTDPPAGCVDSPLRWNESAELATRQCRGGTSVMLDDGPVGAYAADRGAPQGERTGPYPVGSASAHLWRADSNDPDIDDVRWVIQWTASHGRQITLTLDSTRESGLTRPRVLAIARSVR